MIDNKKLKTDGILFVDAVKTNDDLLHLAKNVGEILKSPNGEIIKEIKNQDIENAPRGSQSSIYGLGSFPLHTDTVFWGLPAGYIILKCDGDMRRPTTYLRIETILTYFSSEELVQLYKGIWSVRTPNHAFYTTFSISEFHGYRFDCDLMVPENNFAKLVHNKLRGLCFNAKVNNINWCENMVAVIDNTLIMHGRGAPPEHEGPRTIKRIYVRK